MVANRNQAEPGDIPDLTPGDIARERRVSINKVLAWIAAAELAAVNLATKPNGERPRWRISRKALAEFDRKRAAIPAAAPTPRRKRQSADIPQYV